MEWGRNQRRERERERRAADELERAIEKRRWIYRHHLYAKHVASNSFTRYRPLPTPQQFSSNPDLVSRATVFIRRELRVWDALDVEFLTTFTISLMKSLDIRSEPAVKLLAEFLDMDSDGLRTNAEQFAHELYSYLRSPYRDLNVYDTVVQYDAPEDLSPPHRQERNRRWATETPSPRVSPRASRSPSPGLSRTRPRADTRQRTWTASPRARDNPRSRLPESPSSRGEHRSRTRSGSRPRRQTDADPQLDKGNARGRAGNGEGHAHAAKGKGRAVAGGGGREAGTYMRSRSGDGSDARPAAVEEDAGPGRIRGTAPAGQSARALDDADKASPMGAGLVGPGGRHDGSPPATARNAAQGQARHNKAERPRVGRGAWQSLNTYLAGASVDEQDEQETGRRAQGGRMKPAELSIRGAARQLAGSPPEVCPPPAPSISPAHEEDIHLDRTATGTPAAPAADRSRAAGMEAPGSDVMARVRARLTRIKQEPPVQRPPSSPSSPPAPTPINAAAPAPASVDPPHAVPAQLPMPAATAAAASPRASMGSSSSSSAGAGPAARARLLDRLARERAGAHMGHQREAHRHGDGEAALDAGVLEARLRAEARARVTRAAEGGQDRAGDAASGVATDAGAIGRDLRTREEALRAKLKRSR